MCVCTFNVLLSDMFCKPEYRSFTPNCSFQFVFFISKRCSYITMYLSFIRFQSITICMLYLYLLFVELKFAPIPVLCLGLSLE